MLNNFIEISDKDFCINFGELELCSYCEGCNIDCDFYESINSRLYELKTLIIYNK
ncbi:hypothetical protein ACSXAL_11965 [Clostridium perfringens]|uniref:cobyrinic acid a,c-diamide synthase n=1 Tax=Clostridium perfringens TaxID=1502 RepID=UPI0022485280|nr:cobyrinic acid a,c-diamide synthase [Clostridium perfringens]MCX0394766.1 cobyrinic acid a,c-diamide synthase [Clostridium perfringens]